MFLTRACTAAALFLGACAGCSEKSGAVPDAGIDGGGADAMVDVSKPRDAGTLDSGDAEPDWVTGTWDPVPCPGVPCDVRIARDPGKDVAPLRWRTCVSGRAGCQELVVDWTTAKGRLVGFGGRDAVFPVPGHSPYLHFGKLFLAADYQGADRTVDVAYDIASSTAQFAVATRFANGETKVLSLSMDSFGIAQGLSGRSATIQRIRRSMWANPNQFSTLDVPRSALGGGSVGAVDVSGPAFMQTMWEPYRFQVVSSAGTVHKLSGPIDGVRPVAAGFLTARLANGFPLGFVDGVGALSTVRTPEAGKSVSGYTADRTNGDTLVWVESSGSGPSYSASILYTAPFVTNEAALVPRRVTELSAPAGNGGAFMIAAHGMALIVGEYTRTQLIRLSDGAGWSIDADPGKWITQPLWVDDDEIWLATATIRGTGVDEDGIMRIRRDSLGPPPIPPQ